MLKRAIKMVHMDFPNKMLSFCGSKIRAQYWQDQGTINMEQELYTTISGLCSFDLLP